MILTYDSLAQVQCGTDDRRSPGAGRSQWPSGHLHRSFTSVSVSTHWTRVERGTHCILTKCIRHVSSVTTDLDKDSTILLEDGFNGPFELLIGTDQCEATNFSAQDIEYSNETLTWRRKRKRLQGETPVRSPPRFPGRIYRGA